MLGKMARPGEDGSFFHLEYLEIEQLGERLTGLKSADLAQSILYCHLLTGIALLALFISGNY